MFIVALVLRSGVALFALALYCSLLFLVVLLDIVSLTYCIFQAFISCTGGQSVSCVLLWQPSECVYLINDYVMLFSENKYDDDDAICW